jgi:hypothetical protein
MFWLSYGVVMRDDTKATSVSMLPTATPTAAMGPVYGLVSGFEIPDESPSHAHAQWRTDSSVTHLPLRGQRRNNTQCFTSFPFNSRRKIPGANTSKPAQFADVAAIGQQQLVRVATVPEGVR